MNKSLAGLQILLIAILFLKTGSAHDHAVDATSDVGYTATLFVKSKPKCTVTLISRMWTITACSCVKNVSKNNIQIRIGDPTMAAKVKHKYYKAERVESHPDYSNADGEHPEHNLALIQLSEPFFDSRYVYIAKIPHQLTYWTPDSSLALSLAAYSDLKDSTKTLKDAVWHTNSLLVQPGICLKLKEKYFKLGSTMCASYFHRGGVKNCEFDLGAPLTFDYTLIGILIYKEGCGTEQAVGSFVNIPMHSQWIRERVSHYTSWIHL